MVTARNWGGDSPFWRDEPAAGASRRSGVGQAMTVYTRGSNTAVIPARKMIQAPGASGREFYAREDTKDGASTGVHQCASPAGAVPANSSSTQNQTMPSFREPEQWKIRVGGYLEHSITSEVFIIPGYFGVKQTEGWGAGDHGNRPHGG